jgi:hypothetical protein
MAPSLSKYGERLAVGHVGRISVFDEDVRCRGGAIAAAGALQGTALTGDAGGYISRHRKVLLRLARFAVGAGGWF